MGRSAIAAVVAVKELVLPDRTPMEGALGHEVRSKLCGMRKGIALPDRMLTPAARCTARALCPAGRPAGGVLPAERNWNFDR